MASEMETVAPRPSTEKPNFTVGDLRRAIPKHCFERSAWRSSQYLIADLTAVAALAIASTFIDKLQVPIAAQAVLWALYWFFQGAVCTGKKRRFDSSSQRICAVVRTLPLRC
jgi:omega-6 fatty acid desaturase (delta-12 desaturase)